MIRECKWCEAEFETEGLARDAVMQFFASGGIDE